MATKDFTAQFGSMSTTRIQQGLDKGIWEGDKKEAALSILKRRNIEVSKYVSIPVEEKEEEVVYVDDSPEKIDPKMVKKLNEAMGKIIALDKPDLASKAMEIVGDSQIEDLTLEQAEEILSLIKTRKKQKKSVELSEEKKEIAKQVLSEKGFKKEKIVKLAEAGFTRTETLSLKFVDPVYIYDFYRNQWPDLCK